MACGSVDVDHAGARSGKTGTKSGARGRRMTSPSAWLLELLLILVDIFT